MTIEEAKELYFKYDCSLFGMAREELFAYNEYKALNIPKITEAGWRQELFDVLLTELTKTGEASLFDRMYDLSDGSHNKDRLGIMKGALEYIKYDSLQTKAFISETIIGRTDIAARRGMIFWAYDVGEQESAKELLRFVVNLLNSEKCDEDTISRIKRDIKKCCIIDSYLGLDVCPDYNGTIRG